MVIIALNQYVKSSDQVIAKDLITLIIVRNEYVKSSVQVIA